MDGKVALVAGRLLAIRSPVKAVPTVPEELVR